MVLLSEMSATKKILGNSSRVERRVYHDDNGMPCAAEDGGILDEKSPRVSVKYYDEARGCFGVAMIKNHDGTYEGKKALPFNYSGRNVVGVKTYNEHVQKELTRVIALKGQWGKVREGYVERYGNERAIEEARKNVNKEYCVITDIMKHVINESNKMFEGTSEYETFVIFHDGLKAWWEKEAQAYLATLGFEHRQLRCLGDTNRGTIYLNKVVGNSPELCRGLDSHGFKDLNDSIQYHTTLTSKYDVDDIRAFRMGTPTQVWSKMK